jgi:hypothetical protein
MTVAVPVEYMMLGMWERLRTCSVVRSGRKVVAYLKRNSYTWIG